MIEPRKVYRLESRGFYVCRRLHLPFRFWVRDEQVSTGSKNRCTCGRPLLGPCMTRHSKKRGKSYQQLLPGGLAGENVFTRALRCWLRGLLLILLLEIPGPFALVERSGPECAKRRLCAKVGRTVGTLAQHRLPAWSTHLPWFPASWMGCKGWTRIIARSGARER